MVLARRIHQGDGDNAPDKESLDALDKIPARLLVPWELDGLFSALGDAPDAEAEDVLSELANRMPNVVGHYQWINAVLGRNSKSGLFMLLDFCCDPKFVSVRQKLDGWATSDRIAAFVDEYPDIRTELIRRYQDSAYAGCHRIIEQVLAKSPDTQSVLAMVNNYAANHKPMDYALQSAIEGVALVKVPYEGWQGAYNLYSSAVPELRMQLFQLVQTKGIESGVAESCLVAIDEMRDEYGRTEIETRHPDIESGAPWPLLDWSAD